MDGLTVVFSIYFYIAIDVLLIGLLLKIWKYAVTPAPLKIPLTPAPKTRLGAGGRVLQEVVFFKSLFRSNKTIWVGGYLFHLALLFLFAKHLRFFLPTTPVFIDDLVDIDLFTGFIALGALIFLFILRIVIDRHVFISVVNDYLLLGLLMAIATTGLLNRFWEAAGVRTEIPQIKEFVAGLFTFNPGTAPDNPLFLTHFSLVMLLLIYFPFSKMMHAICIFFSPTRNQADNPRKKRWVTPWAPDKPPAKSIAEPAAAPVKVSEEPSDA